MDYALTKRDDESVRLVRQDADGSVVTREVIGPSAVQYLNGAMNTRFDPNLPSRLEMNVGGNSVVFNGPTGGSLLAMGQAADALQLTSAEADRLKGMLQKAKDQVRCAEERAKKAEEAAAYWQSRAQAAEERAMREAPPKRARMEAPSQSSASALLDDLEKILP